MNKPTRKLVKSAPKGTIWFGGPIDNCKLSLRIYGDDFDPKIITDALGHRPTKSWMKGEPLPSGPRVRLQSAWFLETPWNKEANIDGQVDWIFSRLTPNIRIWKKFGRRFRMDLNTIIYIESFNRGLVLSTASMATISRRGLSLGFDIYFDGDELPKWRKEKVARPTK